MRSVCKPAFFDFCLSFRCPFFLHDVGSSELYHNVAFYKKFALVRSEERERLLGREEPPSSCNKFRLNSKVWKRTGVSFKLKRRCRRRSLNRNDAPLSTTQVFHRLLWIQVQAWFWCLISVG